MKGIRDWDSDPRLDIYPVLSEDGIGAFLEEGVPEKSSEDLDI